MQSLCLVVPCYNEAARLPVDEILRWLSTDSARHIMLVNDGSADATLPVLQELASRHLHAQSLDLAHNQGKAEAVRQGMLAACAAGHELIGYWDADLATPLNETDAFCAVFAREPEVALILGSRVQRLGARVSRNPLRHYSGRVIATLISCVLGLPTYDTQCGAKVFRREMVAVLFQEPFISRWLFDVEILARARDHLGRSAMSHRAVELPLREWHDVAGSKVKPADLLHVLPQLWAIWRRYPASSERA